MSTENELLTLRRNLLACKKEQGRKCLRILLRIWPIMRKQVKYRSLIDEVAGGRLDICDLHLHYLIPFEINLKVIKKSIEEEKKNLLPFFLLLLLSMLRLRPACERLYTRFSQSRTVIFNKCSSFWRRLLGRTIEAKGPFHWSPGYFGCTFKSFSGTSSTMIFHWSKLFRNYSKSMNSQVHDWLQTVGNSQKLALFQISRVNSWLVYFGFWLFNLCNDTCTQI